MPPSNGFREAFAKARKSGAKTFTFNGKRYTTETAAEKAKKMTDKELNKAREDSYERAKLSGYTAKTAKDKPFFQSKSHNEIAESYTREAQYRKGDKLMKMGLNPDKYSDRMKGNFKGSAYAERRPGTKKTKKK